MTYEARVLVPSSLMSVINGYLNAKSESEFQGEDNTISITVHFPDGHEADIKGCGAQEESSWTEAVLFAPTGGKSHGLGQVAYTDPAESFDGEWELEDGNSTYKLTVEDGGNIEQPILANTSVAGEPMPDGWAIS